MENDYRQKIIKSIKILPTLPFVLHKIIQVIDDPKSSAEDLKKTIIKDQSISAKILSLANSAFYGMPNQVTDLTRAIVVLGFNTVVDVAMSVSVSKLFGKGESQEFDKSEFWVYSVATGEAAKMVADKLNIRQTEYAYLLGLLHDLGKVILSNFFEKEYDDIVFNTRANNVPLIKEEKKVFGFDHTDAARMLGTKWKLPDKILIPIAFHHQLDKLPVKYKKEIFLIHLSEYVTRESEIGFNGDPTSLRLNWDIAHEYNIKDNDVKEMVQNLLDDKDKIYKFTEIIV